ncbi:MAG: 16S rRNA (guanine(966)-N(2))-methyltransferase RsmD [Candidatus Omnitrophica bacterium]|nr:16S rRNA (guanine(966)-N(2))-methyltransferase RsmD [Candidatus Omnitrophota bacterium]
MKIISGQYKGRNFYRPDGIRPAQGYVVKSLFDTLGQDLEGLVFLDLFAGSGAVGMEALSRGARHCTFVERDRRCVKVISQNATLLGIEAYSLIAGDVFANIKTFAAQEDRFDIIFCDPPYERDMAKKSLKTLGAYDILQPASIVIFKHEQHEILPSQNGRLVRFKEKKYGATLLSFYQPDFTA